MTWLRQAVFGGALLAALAGLLWTQQQRVKLLDADLTRSREDAYRHSANTALLRVQLHSERRAQMHLRTLHQQLNGALAARQLLIEELTHANAELRLWAAQPLPDPARRLRQRPVLIGADAYRQWLSGRNTLPTAGDPAAQ